MKQIRTINDTLHSTIQILESERSRMMIEYNELKDIEDLAREVMAKKYDDNINEERCDVCVSEIFSITKLCQNSDCAANKLRWILKKREDDAKIRRKFERREKEKKIDEKKVRKQGV